MRGAAIITSLALNPIFFGDPYLRRAPLAPALSPPCRERGQTPGVA